MPRTNWIRFNAEQKRVRQILFAVLYTSNWEIDMEQPSRRKRDAAKWQFVDEIADRLVAQPYRCRPRKRG